MLVPRLCLGSTNRHAKTEIVALLQQESIGISYDLKMDSSKNINCLDQKSLDIFFKRMGHSKYTNEALTKWHILKKIMEIFFHLFLPQKNKIPYERVYDLGEVS